MEDYLHIYWERQELSQDIESIRELGVKTSKRIMRNNEEKATRRKSGLYSLLTWIILDAFLFLSPSQPVIKSCQFIAFLNNSTTPVTSRILKKIISLYFKALVF